MQKKITLIGLCFLVCLSAACSLAGNAASATSKSAAAPAASAAKEPDQFASTFEIQFQGKSNWLYRLNTRKAGGLREESLHLEGIDKARNPGDIRMVTDGTTTWMIGPGTDQECVQFSNNQGMDPALILPETLVPFDNLGSQLKPAGEESIAGRSSQHFSGIFDTIGNWKYARVETWQDAQNQDLLRFTLQASGNDAIFGSGSGKIYARYKVDSLQPDAIQPVAGCKIDVPLPESAQNYVRLPGGMASFDTAQAPEAVIAYYQKTLPQQGWTEKEAPAQANGATVLQYTHSSEDVEIDIAPPQNGTTRVKLIFVQAK
jgi:hypothetical protein